MASDRIQALIRRVLGEILDQTPELLQSDLTQRVEALVLEEVERERARCVQLCRARSELWQRALSGPVGGLQYARDEARARSNEARYLADLVEREEPPPAELPN